MQRSGQTSTAAAALFVGACFTYLVMRSGPRDTPVCATAAPPATVAVSGAALKSSAYLQNDARRRGVKPLHPGMKGECWFHGQAPHHQDRGMFERYGGTVGSCRTAKVTDAMFSSVAELCDCQAPPASAFRKHFLEIGAVDGQYLSNLAFFEMQMGWTGICVEGSPSTFAYLAANRPVCRNYNNVIGEEKGTKRFFTFMKEHDWLVGMSAMEGTAFKTSEEASAYAVQVGATLEVHEVPMRRLADIFAEAGLTNFGWLMVDVEGAEDFIFSTIDFSAVRADYISFEGEHPLSEKLITAAGYKHIGNLGVDKLFSERFQ